MNKQKRPPGTLFIAFSGKPGAGKDTAAKMSIDICRQAGLRATAISFAKPLKDMCIDILGLDRELVYGTQEQKSELCHIEWDGFPLDVRLKYSEDIDLFDGRRLPRCGPMTIREVLQVVGTDIFRTIYSNVWAQAPFNQNWEDFDVVLLSDCRFPNEKSLTEDNNGVTIRIDRSLKDSHEHPSENSLDDAEFNFRYQNDGSLIELYEFLQHAMSEIL
jgi:hypothetical protein